MTRPSRARWWCGHTDARAWSAEVLVRPLRRDDRSGRDQVIASKARLHTADKVARWLRVSPRSTAASQSAEAETAEQRHLPGLGAAWASTLRPDATAALRKRAAGAVGAEPDQFADEHQAIHRRPLQRSRRGQDRGPPVPGQSDG